MKVTLWIRRREEEGFIGFRRRDSLTGPRASLGLNKETGDCQLSRKGDKTVAKVGMNRRKSKAVRY